MVILGSDMAVVVELLPGFYGYGLRGVLFFERLFEMRMGQGPAVSVAG